MIFFYLFLRLCLLVDRFFRQEGLCSSINSATIRFSKDNRVVIQYVVFKAITYLSSGIFCLLTLIWFIIIGNVTVMSYSSYSNLTPAIIIVGWLHTLEYLKGIEYFSSFSKYLKLVIFKDVLLFGCVFAFVIVGFALAIQVYIQVDDAYNNVPTSSIWSTVFDTFGMAIGSSESFSSRNDRFDSLKDGINSTAIKVLFVVYLCLSTIMLLNLLIARLNKSYEEIDRELKLLWVYENMKLITDLSASRSELILRPTRFIMKRFVFEEDGVTMKVYLDEQTLLRRLLGYDVTNEHDTANASDLSA
jgi:hypothetical protein